MYNLTTEKMIQFYYFYLITNKINGKKYVGVTIRKPSERFWQHIGSNSGSLINCAIKKYGKNNFNFEVIKSIETTRLRALEIETEYILLHQSLQPRGYNILLHQENFWQESTKIFHIITPNRDTILIKNLAKFCRDHRLNQSQFYNEGCSKNYYFKSKWDTLLKCEKCLEPTSAKDLICTKCKTKTRTARKQCKNCFKFNVTSKNKSGVCRDCQLTRGSKGLKKLKNCEICNNPNSFLNQENICINCFNNPHILT